MREEHNPPDFVEYKVVDLLSNEQLSVGIRNTPGVLPDSSAIALASDEAFTRAITSKGDLPSNLQYID